MHLHTGLLTGSHTFFGTWAHPTDPPPIVEQQLF